MATIDTMIIAPFKEMMFYVAGFIPTLLSIFVILIIGLAVAKLLHTALHRLLKELRIDKLSEKTGLSDILHKGGIKHKLSDLLCTLVNVVVIVIFLVIMVQVLGLMTMPALFAYLIGYLSHVITAVFVLALGMILAKMVSGIIYMVACNMGMPNPKLHERISKWAIVLYAAKFSLEELGFGMIFVGTTFHIVLGGVVFGLALAFGLGGKDAAAGYLSKKK